MIVSKITNLLKNLWDLWKTHELELKNVEKSVTDQLHANNLVHQNRSLVFEKDLNAVLDRMRQDSNKQNLKENLDKCTGLLDRIKMR